MIDLVTSNNTGSYHNCGGHCGLFLNGIVECGRGKCEPSRQCEAMLPENGGAGANTGSGGHTGPWSHCTHGHYQSHHTTQDFQWLSKTNLGKRS